MELFPHNLGGSNTPQPANLIASLMSHIAQVVYHYERPSHVSLISIGIGRVEYAGN